MEMIKKYWLFIIVILRLIILTWKSFVDGIGINNTNTESSKKDCALYTNSVYDYIDNNSVSGFHSMSLDRIFYSEKYNICVAVISWLFNSDRHNEEYKLFNIDKHEIIAQTPLYCWKTQFTRFDCPEDRKVFYEKLNDYEWK